jgi:FkbH-like protein
MENKILFISNTSNDFFVDELRKKYNVEEYTGYSSWESIIYDKQFLTTISLDTIVILLIHGNSIIDNIVFNSKDSGFYNFFIRTFITKFRFNKIITNLINYDVPLFPKMLDYKSIDEVNRYNKHLIEMSLAFNNLILFDTSALVKQYGYYEIYSNKIRYLSGSPYSLKAHEFIINIFNRIFMGIKSEKKKVLILDLDNTLWGGELIDSGIENIEVGTHAKGFVFYEAQKWVKRIKEHGALLAIVTKNYLDDVINAFSKGKNILTLEDFVKVYANFEDKSKSIQELADYLNLPYESFVFIDDNPIERHEVESVLPGIVVPDFPTEVDQIPNLFESIFNEYFWSPVVTEEDSNKLSLYKSENERNHKSYDYGSREEFIVSLEIELKIYSSTETKKERAIQLLNKTNQFNFTRERFSDNSFLGKFNQNTFYVVNASDKFGNYGDIFVLLFERIDNSIEIVNIAMSCRVMNRKIEHDLMDEFISEWADKGISKVLLRYARNERNHFLLKFLEDLGFEIESKSGEIFNFTINLQNYEKLDKRLSSIKWIHND